MELAYFIQEIAGFEKGLDGFFEESTLSVYDSDNSPMSSIPRLFNEDPERL